MNFIKQWFVCKIRLIQKWHINKKIQYNIIFYYEDKFSKQNDICDSINQIKLNRIMSLFWDTGKNNIKCT